MKREYKFLLALLFFVLAILTYWQFMPANYFNYQESWSLLFFSAFIFLAGLLLGLLSQGRPLSLKCLNKGEKIRILANCHPANSKLGNKGNYSYYLIKRGTDKKIYAFKGPENYQHLPFRQFNFIWDGKKLVPKK